MPPQTKMRRYAPSLAPRADDTDFWICEGGANSDVHLPDDDPDVLEACKALLRTTCTSLANGPGCMPAALQLLKSTNESLPPHMRVLLMQKKVCLAPANVGVLVNGGRRAGLPPHMRGATAVTSKFPLGEEEMRSAMQAVLGDVRSDFGQGLVPINSEAALHVQLNLAHEMGVISLVDKDGLRCADIVDPHKLASIPELSTLHELLQRIARFMRAGRSISSGGGTQAGGFRAHFRIVPHGRHSTPGTMEWGHLDSVCSLRVASAAKRLYASDPQNTCAACHPPGRRGR